jgi:hypothetical protein
MSYMNYLRVVSLRPVAGFLCAGFSDCSAVGSLIAKKALTRDWQGHVIEA